MSQNIDADKNTADRKAIAFDSKSFARGFIAPTIAS
jgi:hypothetical protein